MFFKKLKEKKVNNIIKEINSRDLFKRYLLLVIGCFIVAFAFNLFFLKYGIVCFGISGLSIVVNEFGFDPSLFILLGNIVLLIVSFFALGFLKTKNSIIGSLLFPLFVKLTSYLTANISLGDVEMIVIAIFGSVLTGVGYGIIFKTGFTTGGTDILDQIISKYSKISLGSSMLIVDGLVVLSAKLVFSWEIVLYGAIVLYIISTLTDKVILGISQSKAFYIVTEKEEEVKTFLLSILNGGVTLINARGGYSNEKQHLLLGVVPTRSYYVVKEGLKQIDDKIFFLVCDAYEVSSREKIKNE